MNLFLFLAVALYFTSGRSATNNKQRDDITYKCDTSV